MNESWYWQIGQITIDSTKKRLLAILLQWNWTKKEKKEAELLEKDTKVVTS